MDHHLPLVGRGSHTAHVAQRHGLGVQYTRHCRLGSENRWQHHPKHLSTAPNKDTSPQPPRWGPNLPRAAPAGILNTPSRPGSRPRLCWT